jgi:translation elongation factor EF-Tu-like GTPase
MSWKFWRRDVNPMDPQALLAQAHAQQPPRDVAPQDVVPGSAGFRLTVADVFAITGRGTVVTGRVESGVVAMGDTVTLTRAGTPIARTVVKSIEMFRRTADRAEPNDNVGLLLDGIQRDQVTAGDVLTA